MGPAALADAFNRQFSRPSGPLGWLAGEVMAWENAGLNRDVVHTLEIGPADRVLDVGCGPGIGVAAAARLAAGGRVAGVDPSAVMIRTARRRNRAAVESGRVLLRQAAVEDMPFEDEAFTRAFAVNTVGLWSSPQRGFAQLRRVLAPGGRLLIAYRRTRSKGRDARSLEASQKEGIRIQEGLLAAEFDEIHWSERRQGRGVVAILDAI